MGYCDNLALSKLLEMIKTARKIVTVSHTHPDGDAIGSSLAMHSSLLASGKEIISLFPDPIPGTLSFIPSGQKIIIGSTSPSEAKAAIAGADLIIGLDFNVLDRVENLKEFIAESKAPKVLIDHHIAPETQAFDLVFSQPQSSSTCELLYFILSESSLPLPLESAEALMTGMTTDSNNFSNSVTARTFEMAGELIALGVDRNAILDKIYHNHKENRLRLLGYILQERMNIVEQGVSYIILDKATLSRFGISEGETEGFVNIPLSIGAVRMSVLLKEDEDCFRVSVRSRNGVSARDFAEKYFSGGGHQQASGGKLPFIKVHDDCRPMADVGNIGDVRVDIKAAVEYVEAAAKEFFQV